MVTYSKRGFDKSICPNVRQMMYGKFMNITQEEGLRLYNKSDPLPIDDIRGPDVKPDDIYIVLDYVEGVSVFYLIKYFGVE